MNELTNLENKLQNIDDIKQVVYVYNEAESYRYAFKQVKGDFEDIFKSSVIKVRAARRAGEIIIDGHRNGTIKSQGRPQKTYLADTFYSDLKISRVQGSRWQKIARIDEITFEQYISDKKEKNKETSIIGVILYDMKINPLKYEIKNKPVIYSKDGIKWLESLEDNCADLLFTDPPYSTDIEDINEFSKWVNIAFKKVKPTGRIFICTGPYPKEQYAYLNQLLSQNKFSIGTPLIWTYRNTLGPTPQETYKINYQVIHYLYGQESDILDCPIMNEHFTVQDINAPDGRIGDRYYKWQKPDKLAERLIKHTTKENDFIIDPFAGVGTFLIMAGILNRKAEGCEIDKDVYNISIKRGCIDG